MLLDALINLLFSVMNCVGYLRMFFCSFFLFECQCETSLFASRSHKEKRSSYAPETGVRYDGVYRIEKCWRKNGIQVNF